MATVRRFFRCVMACAVTFPVWAAAQDAANEAAPAFTDGNTAWYTAGVVRAKVEKLPNECERRFGEAVETDIEPAPGSRPSATARSPFRCPSNSSRSSR